MSKLRIFIENKELDTLDSVTVPITKQYEELSDPTVICNDYSKTVTIPMSKKNNEIFGYCFKPDRLIVESDSEPLVGIYFDPYKKLACRLQWGDAVVLQGYAKVLKITNSGYELTINGELGRIFQELKKISFNKDDFETDEEASKYWIDGSEYVEEVLNKELIFKCWNNNSRANIYKKADPAYDVTNVIGFLPNNAYNDDFDYKTYQKIDGSTTTFEETLQANKFEEATGFSISSVIGDGLLPIQQNTYRSYEQIPYIYWSRFVDIFNDKAKELTGYSIDWPDIDNDIAVVCKQRDEAVKGIRSFEDSSLQMTAMSQITFPLYANNISINMSGLNIKNNVLTLDNKLFTFTFKPTLSFVVTRKTGVQFNVSSIGFGKLNAIKYEILQGLTSLTAETLGTMIFYKSELEAWRLSELKAKYPNAQYQPVDNIPVEEQLVSYNVRWTANTNMVCTTDIINGDTRFWIRLTYMFVNSDEKPNNHIITFYDGDNTMAALVVTFLSYNMSPSSNTTTDTLFRTGSIITLNDFCDLKFADILNYCKLNRISISVDYVDKKIKFYPAKFADYTIVDHTTDIDMSKDFSICPIVFDHHKIIFNYDENESSLNNAYHNNYNVSYAGKILTTNYNFDNNEQKLFSGLTTTVLYSPSQRCWFYNLNKNLTLIRLFKNTFLCCANDDNEYVSQRGAFFYPERQAANFPIPVRIDDDTLAQLSANNFYTSWNNYIASNYITGVSVVKDRASCLINTPSEVYTYDNQIFKDTSSIYDNKWNTYIEERYNIQNKLVTCYIKLSPIDFINFSWNQFWKIGNQLYIVNKIYDYDITSEAPTKVDLITVQNINNYLQ